MSVHRFIITIINSTQVRHQYTVCTYCIDPDLGRPWHPFATDVISVPDPLESRWIALLSKSSRSTSAMVELCTVSHSVMPFFWSPHHTQPLLLFKRQVASSTSSGERIIRVFFEWVGGNKKLTRSWLVITENQQQLRQCVWVHLQLVSQGAESNSLWSTVCSDVTLMSSIIVFLQWPDLTGPGLYRPLLGPKMPVQLCNCYDTLDRP